MLLFSVVALLKLRTKSQSFSLMNEKTETMIEVTMEIGADVYSKLDVNFPSRVKIIIKNHNYTMSEKTAIKDVIKDLKTSLQTLDERCKELRKDLDVNVVLSTTTSNRVDTLKAKKEDTEKLKSHQIEQSSQFNINFKNIQTKLDTIDRDYSILASKMDALTNSLTADFEALKRKIDAKFESERAYLDERHSGLVTKITALVNALDEKLTAQIQKVAEETVM